MKIINASYEIMTPIDGAAILKAIETAGRVCYKSENAITEGSAEQFVAGIIKSGHESVLEHVSITVRFVVDRGISHQIVRHRIASYSQESTRINYKDGLTVVKPFFWEEDSPQYRAWKGLCEQAETCYLGLIATGVKPVQARNVLPTSTKTEVVMTANLREWRHVFRLRTAKDAHPQIREVAVPLLEELKRKIPVVFGDL